MRTLLTAALLLRPTKAQTVAFDIIFTGGKIFTADLDGVVPRHPVLLRAKGFALCMTF